MKLTANIYGCDICQEACPWNQYSEPTSESAYLPSRGLHGESLIELLRLTQDQFSKKFKVTLITSGNKFDFLPTEFSGEEDKAKGFAEECCSSVGELEKRESHSFFMRGTRNHNQRVMCLNTPYYRHLQMMKHW